MAFPVTLNGRTYTLADFAGTNYVEGLPDAFEDFVTQAGSLYSTTSTTSNTIGTGSKTFTVEASKPYQVGTPLRIADTAAPSTNWIDGIVTAYSGTTLTVNAVAYAGSGTKTAWSINIGGGPIAYTGTLPVAQGGTGATTAADARTNLDTYSKAEADSRFLNVSGEASDVTMTGNVTIGDAAGDTLTVNATADFNTGINVDGTITSDGLTVASNGAQILVQDVNDIGSISFKMLNSSGVGATFNHASDTRLLSLSVNDTLAMTINNGNDISFYEDTGTTPKLFWDASAEALGIGTSSPAWKLEIDNGADNSLIQVVRGAGNGYIGLGMDGDTAVLTAGTSAATEPRSLVFRTANSAGVESEAMRIDSSGNVGIGTSSPAAKLHTLTAFNFGLGYNDYSGDGLLIECEALNASDGGYAGGISFTDIQGGGRHAGIAPVQTGSDNNQIGLAFFSKASTSSTSDLAERMRIDSSGKLLVGKTSDDNTSPGLVVNGNGYTKIVRQSATANVNTVLALNRLTTDGSIADFQKDGDGVGSIGNIAGRFAIYGTNNVGIAFDVNQLIPTNGSGSLADNVKDLGNISYRWDDIYATNGTIQTSDRNEKQDIAELDEAEKRVAIAAKGLIRKYRWKDAVAEKGDEARIHVGIIAQDLQDAFAAEGLDAGRYAMFISSTWWEKERVIPAIEAQDAVYETVTIPAVLDDEGNEIEPETTEERLVSEAVEGREEQTVIDTFETAEEAPEGATERTRLGVRYPELLAFIIGAL